MNIVKKIILTKVNNKILSYILLLFFILLLFIIYKQSFNNNFVHNWDDKEQITQNYDIKNFSVNSIIKIFTSFYAGMYQPLTTLSFLIEYSLFKSDSYSFHFISFLFHCFNVLIVYVFIFLITKNYFHPAIAVIFFAFHPMAVESICWISSRSNLFYAFFYLCSLSCYILFLENKKIKLLNFSLAFFILSLLSKSAAITLPLVLFLLDYFYNKRIIKKDVSNKIPFIVLSIVFLVISFLSRASVDAIHSLPSAYNFFDKIFLLSYSIVFYIVGFLFPFKLSALHYYPDKINNLLPYEYYFSFFILLFFVFIIFKSFKKKKIIFFGFLFYLITISIVLQIIPIGQAIVAERYSYLPYIGLSFIASSFIIKLFYIDNLYKRIFRFAGAILLFIIIIFFSFVTNLRTKVWKNEMTLFSDIILKYPDKAFGYFQRGNAYFNQKNYSNAIIDYDKAVSLKLLYYDVFLNRGLTKYYLNDLDGALKDYYNAIEINPKKVEVYNNIGIIEGRQNNYDVAIKFFHKAIDIMPEYADAYNNIGYAYLKIKNFDKSIEFYNMSVKYNPKNPESYKNRGLAKAYNTDYIGAINDWKMLINIQPFNIDAYVNISSVKEKMKDYVDALNYIQIAFQLQPDNPKILYNRGVIRLHLSDTSGACNDIRRSMQLGFNPANDIVSVICKKSNF